MLNKILENIGLTGKEAKVYLAALEIGSNPVSKIGAKAKINRVTTYDILEKLTKKGLISSFTKAKIKYFTATDPEIVVQEYQKRIADLEKSLPDLKRLNGETTHPRVRYFEGLEGIKGIYRDTLTSKTEILNYGDSKEIRTHWPTYDEDYVMERANKKIYLRGIALDDDHGKRVQHSDEKYFREIRLVAKEKFDFSNEIHIYDDKVAIISFKDELIGMIIESHEIANTQRALFKMVWEFSEKKEPINFSSPPEMTVRKVGNVKSKAPETPVLENQETLF
jgi:HTH-type transcriptional regulator, sugar sensing transcriptional regulator